MFISQGVFAAACEPTTPKSKAVGAEESSIGLSVCRDCISGAPISTMMQVTLHKLCS